MACFIRSYLLAHLIGGHFLDMKCVECGGTIFEGGRCRNCRTPASARTIKLRPKKEKQKEKQQEAPPMKTVVSANPVSDHRMASIEKQLASLADKIASLSLDTNKSIDGYTIRADSKDEIDDIVSKLNTLLSNTGNKKDDENSDIISVAPSFGKISVPESIKKSIKDVESTSEEVSKSRLEKLKKLKKDKPGG